MRKETVRLAILLGIISSGCGGCVLDDRPVKKDCLDFTIEHNKKLSSDSTSRVVQGFVRCDPRNVPPGTMVYPGNFATHAWVERREGTKIFVEDSTFGKTLQRNHGYFVVHVGNYFAQKYRESHRMSLGEVPKHIDYIPIVSVSRNFKLLKRREASKPNLDWKHAGDHLPKKYREILRKANEKLYKTK
ncbi:MAG: hypothetical protein KKF56_01020 [Nanoarchaeota archaeon]|nr:hypothetical protein [Nanoarchaeota archaeon]